ncbi:MAG: molybdopterin-dependent oxidoreductase [Caldilineaceae bacterium]|jgi:DMSO/TMAO reductase YedYZ molybdopterin-dependent catalytic subunit/thiosulfate reductase cytochrome b subunit|nr:molybdopterin-dependent oxidoreductase [Caldilineaceae bacterium]
MHPAADKQTAKLAAQLTPGRDRVVEGEWAGGIPQEMATLPQVRLGRQWFSFKQILGAGFMGGAVVLILSVLLARYLRTLPDVQAFITQYPGIGAFSLPVNTGFPWWLRIQHYFNFVLLLFIIRSGLQILADHPRLTFDHNCTPDTEFFRLRGAVPKDRIWTAKDDTVALPGWLGLPGIRHTIGLARSWHFSLDLFWVANGVVFYMLLFSTDQWQRLIPVSWDVFPHAASVALQYLSLDFPPRSGWSQYNALQSLAYFTTVFFAAPLALLTGLLQSPAIAGKFGTGAGIFNRQVSRTVHFGVLLYFVAFLVMHVTLVFITGARVNLNHITSGANTDSWQGVWLFLLGIAIVVGLWIAATPFTLRYPRVVQETGRFLVGWIKGGMEQWNPRAEYSEADIAPYLWINGALPDKAEYARLKSDGFRNFKLKIGGLVENPVEISLDELKRMTKQEQITQTYCIQGWSGIAKWGGVPMQDILALVRPKPEAKIVVFFSFAHGPDPGSGLYYDAHPIANMHHSQTILAYEMNDSLLTELHGAPLRLRDELELGFKQIKWVQAIAFVESFKPLGSGQGGFNEDYEFFDWRAPI